jgi:type I restriction enzyme S subunit
MFSGGTPQKSDPQYWNGEIPWISASSMHNVRVHSSKHQVTQSAIGNGTRLARAGSTLVLVRGMSLLSEIRIAHATRDVAFNQDVKALVARPGIEPLFLTYALQARHLALLSEVHLAGHGTGVLATQRLKALSFPLPPLPEQRRIVEFLTFLDDLVDVNESLSSSLEALARAKGIEFLASHSGDELVAIDEIASVTRGYSYKSSELVEGSGWLVGLKNVGRGGVFRSEGFKPLTAAPRAEQIVENGDLLIAHTDLTQARDVIGRPVRVRRGELKGDLVASLDLAVVRPGAQVTVEYLHAVFESDQFRQHALSFCNGTTVLHMGSAAVPSFLVGVPTGEKMREFSDEVKPLRLASDDALAFASTLRRTRDELLPLLMSGEVRVSDAALTARGGKHDRDSDRG